MGEAGARFRAGNAQTAVQPRPGRQAKTRAVRDDAAPCGRVDATHTPPGPYSPDATVGDAKHGPLKSAKMCRFPWISSDFVGFREKSFDGPAQNGPRRRAQAAHTTSIPPSTPRTAARTHASGIGEFRRSRPSWGASPGKSSLARGNGGVPAPCTVSTDATVSLHPTEAPERRCDDVEFRANDVGSF